MKLTSVEMTSSDLVEPLSFSLKEGLPASQYIVRAITGIDAEDIVAKFYGFGQDSGKPMYDFHLKPREIVMRVILQPRLSLKETYSNVRDTLYRAISATRNGLVKLGFKAEATLVSQIYGKISKFEVGYFNQIPEVQLTFLCDDPVLKGPNPIKFTDAQLGGTNPIKVWDSISTAPHGFTMRLIFTAGVSEFLFKDASTHSEWGFHITRAFVSGDVLYVCSDYQNLDVHLNGVTPLMDQLTPASNWPIIFPGRNQFYSPQIASFNWDLFQFFPAYWGI